MMFQNQNSLYYLGNGYSATDSFIFASRNDPGWSFRSNTNFRQNLGLDVHAKNGHRKQERKTYLDLRSGAKFPKSAIWGHQNQHFKSQNFTI